MIGSILLTVFFFSTLLFIGVQALRWSLGESRIEYFLALGIIVGITLYTFLVNLIGHFLSVSWIFEGVLIFLVGIACLGQYYLARYPRLTPFVWAVPLSWRIAILSFTFFIVITVGFVSLRHPVDNSIFRVATAATMVEGNFPPVQIWNPSSPFNYHYAPDLFVAAMTKLTGLPLYMAYSSERAVLGGAVVLLAFLLTLTFFPGQFFVATIATISTLYAGSVEIFNLLRGLPFLIGQGGDFSFVSDAIGGMGGTYASPVITTFIIQHWGAFALALMLAIIYLFLHLTEDASRLRYGAISLIAIILALLALVSEPYFAVLCAALAFFPLFYFLRNNGRESAKRITIASLLVIGAAMTLAFIQGGYVRSTIVEQFNFEFAKSLNETPLFKREGKPFKLTNPETFVRSYGKLFIFQTVLLLALSVPALVYLLRRRFQAGILIALTMVFIVGPPLMLASDYDYLTELLWRFFYPLNMLGGFVIGIFLAFLFIEAKASRVKKYAMVVVAGILLAQGVFTHALYVVFGAPPGTPIDVDAPLFTPQNAVAAKAYSWVKEHTSSRDLFFILRAKDDIECGVHYAPNCLFIHNTGRLAPTYRRHPEGVLETTAPEKAALFDLASRNCDSDILESLGYTYLFIDGRWPLGLEGQCLEKNHSNLVFQADGGGENSIRIYKLAY